LAAKLQKRIDDKDFISSARLKTQYKKKLKGLKEYLQKELMCEKLVLKRKDNMIYVVPDDAKSRNEPFRNKEKLKKVEHIYDIIDKYKSDMAKYTSHGGAYFEKPKRPSKIKSYSFDPNHPVIAENLKTKN